MTDSRFIRRDGALRVQSDARRLAGLTQPPPAGDVLFEAVVQTALALCNRREVPPEMESALSVLLAQAYEGGLGRSVSTVKRGDTSITYAAGGLAQWRELLAPFTRLGSPL